MKNGKDMKFKNLILNNFALKILAVVLAVILWVVIVNIDNPSRTSTISGIPVVLQNEETLVNKGYTYAVQSGSIISITVKAPQTIVENLEASDFYAYADLSELSPTSDRTPIKIKCQKSDVANQVDIVSLRTEYVQLSIDNKLSKDVAIEAEYVGNPASGYVVGECSVSPTTVTVTGAESIVNRIETARVNYNISNMTQSIYEEARITFYDGEGNEVKSDLLTLSRGTAKINIEINPIKKVPVNFAITGSPEEGYVVSDFTGSLSEVTISGNKSILDKVTSIDIPAENIKTEGINKDTEFEIPLAVYLPSGCKIVSANKNLVISVKVLREREIEIPYEKINLTGCSDIYDYEIAHKDAFFTIKAIGNKNVIEKLTANDFYLTASVGGKKTGTYDVRVSFEENENYQIEETYEISVVITDKKTEEKPTKPEEKPTEEEKETETESKEME